MAVEDAFAALGLQEAASALDAALRGVAEMTRRRLLVHCPHCTELSEDERLLLDAAASAQNGQFDLTRTILDEIVPPSTTDLIIGRLSGLGRLLALAGIDLPGPDEVGLAEPHGLRSVVSPATLH